MIRLLMTSEIASFFYFLFQSIPSPEQLSWFDQYGPLSVAALAIITNFYFLVMNNKRDMARDKQQSQRDSENNEALRAIAVAMKDTANALHEGNREIAVVRSIVERQ